MTDVTKYKSVAIDHESYKKIEELTTCLTPGITLSRAQVVKILVNNKTSENKNTNEAIKHNQLFLEKKPVILMPGNP